MLVATLYLSPILLQRIIFFSAVSKAKIGTQPIIYTGIVAVYNEFASLLQQSDASVSAQALECMQHMVF